MKLLLVTERFAPDLGGVARSAERTAQALAALGHEVHVLAWTRTLEPGRLESAQSGPFPEAVESGVSKPSGSNRFGSVVVHRLGLYAAWDLSMQHTLNVLDWLQSEVALDAVWGHYLFPAGFMAVLFARNAGLPVTVSARGNDVDRLAFPPGDFARLIWTLERADLVTAVSNDLARRIEVLTNTRQGVLTLANVVDSELFAPTADAARLLALKAELSIPDGSAVLGFCGELRHKKGLPFLLRALAEVNQHRPARLLVIGDVRPREQSTIADFELECPGISGLITVTGHTEDRRRIPLLLELCDCVLQPSLWDGMPNAVLEAMSCGRVVIASDAGGLPEMITHGDSGCLIPRSQLHRLGEAILEVLSLPKDAASAIGHAARQRVLDEFQPEGEARRLSRVLELLCRSRCSPDSQAGY